MERRHSSTEISMTIASSAQSGLMGTDGSIFTDSAIDMDAASTPPRQGTSIENDIDPELSHSLRPNSLAGRLRRVAAAARTLDQEDKMPKSKKRQIEHKLKIMETLLDDDNVFAVEVQDNALTTKQVDQNSLMASEEPGAEGEDEQEVWIEEEDLFQIHDNLVESISSMRLRQQEQRHLHQLTATKLEAVAQRCLFQEQQMQELLREMKALRHENRSLGQENDKLRGSITELELEASKNEVAVSAMTSAVAGLEGWIDDTDKPRAESPVAITPFREGRPRHAVVRGKGRFRGRYYIDDDHERSLTRSDDARELQDGVRAWIRGFRDVEDACSSPGSGRKELYHKPIDTGEDDWGDFERPSPIQ